MTTVWLVIDTDQVSWKDIVDGVYETREKAEEYRLAMEKLFNVIHKDRWKIVPYDVE